MLQGVQITKTDGNLAVSFSSDRILAVIAPSSSGTANTPTPLSSKADLVAGFTSGKLVEACALFIDAGIPIVAISCAASTAATYGSIAKTASGNATVAAAATPKPDGDYDVIVQILAGGALGTAGISYRYSLDNGVTWSQPTALGTSLTMACANGVTFTLGTTGSTLVTGDTWSVSTVGPRSTSSDLQPAYDALSAYDGEWLRALVMTDADSTIIGQAITFANSFHTYGKYPEVILCTRARGSAETHPAYQTAMAAISSAVQSAEICTCVDQCEMVSSVSGRRLRLPQSIAVTSRLMTNDDSQDASAPGDGALPNVFLSTAAGVPAYHDEIKWPGLDDLYFTALTTKRGRPKLKGTFVNNPRVMSGPTSDYQFFQLSALENRIIEQIYALLTPRLSRGLLCDPTTGQIRADIAKSIEDDINGQLRNTFCGSTPKCSAVQFYLSRTDNVLLTQQISFSNYFVPLAYPKKFVGKSGLAAVLPKAA